MLTRLKREPRSVFATIDITNPRFAENEKLVDDFTQLALHGASTETVEFIHFSERRHLTEGEEGELDVALYHVIWKEDQNCFGAFFILKPGGLEGLAYPKSIALMTVKRESIPHDIYYRTDVEGPMERVPVVPLEDSSVSTTVDIVEHTKIEENFFYDDED